MVLIFWFFTKDITNALVAKICLLQFITQRKKKTKKYVATVWCEHITTIFIFYIKLLPLLQNKDFAAFWLFALSVRDYVKKNQQPNTQDTLPPNTPIWWLFTDA